MTDDLINIKRVAEILGVSERTIHRYAATGRLTKYNRTAIDRTPLFSESEVWALLKPRPVG
jgi:DNA-binding transcriptional MerR regulator